MADSQGAAAAPTGEEDLRQELLDLGVEAAAIEAAAGPQELRAVLRAHLQQRPWPFQVRHLSDRTLVIVELDRFGERPHIYVVRGPRKAVVIDTGCATANLFDFLLSLPELDGLQFQVVNTHVHYDHIMGNHTFCRAAGSLRPRCRGICQGARDRRFSENWRETSLQKTVGASIQGFSVTQWLQEGERIYLDDDSPSDAEALEVLYTPGHTPDSISLYLPVENRLFTGDLIYPGGIYLFLPGSSLEDFAQSLGKLRRFVAGRPPGLVLGCGHITHTLEAGQLDELHELLPAIRDGTAEKRVTRSHLSPERLAVFGTPSFTLMCRCEDVP
mmetsp:Transcript_71877/g.222187  ORF Transcript_71877/g.222187 Transcript_71877/m.222187 type:complete len:329 (-) Transcript_71877:68-1054(-)